MKYLFIAEKTSLMQDVMNCYNKHQDQIIKQVGYIDFIALSGHVCTINEPNDYSEWADKKWDEVDYPMIPVNWIIKPIDKPKPKKIISDIKSKVRNYDGIIVGTDSDVEGYGIYHLLENYLGITDMKALRFIEHSLTDEEILQSLLTMTDYHNDITHKRFTQSFILRSHADWLYGMNATRMLSNKMNHLIATGRVKAPTIKLVYDNSMAIENFKPTDYWNLVINYGDFIASLTEDGKTAKAYYSMDDIPDDIDIQGVVKEKQNKKTQTSAPKLYDLAAIQSEAGQHYGFSPDETLSIIQSLYEKHKLLSYPRTQCRYVSKEKAKEFALMVKHMRVFDELKDIASQVTAEDFQKVMTDKNVVNDTEVQKESHDALLPTSKEPNLDELSDNEKKICLMVYKRLLAQFLPKLEEYKTTVIINHGKHDFVAKGKTVINQGWRVLYGKSKDNIIPDLHEGDVLEAEDVKVVKKVTTPPKRLTEATLLNAMVNIASLIEDKELKKNLAESKGIGTSATRANIIKDIIERNYVEKKKNELYITEMGKKYIDCVKTLDIVSPVFAALLETKIHKIQRGEIDYNEVYQEMIKDLKNMCRQIDNMERVEEKVHSICPKCKSNIKVDRYYYICPKCGLKVSRNIAGLTITQDILNTLLAGKSTGFYQFKKKDKSTFKAKLIMKDNEVVFNYDSGISCPRCLNPNIKLNNGGAFCDCGLKVFRNVSQHKLTDDEIKRLLKDKELKNLSFKSKAGDSYKADLILADDTTKIVFNK